MEPAKTRVKVKPINIFRQVSRQSFLWLLGGAAIAVILSGCTPSSQNENSGKPSSSPAVQEFNYDEYLKTLQTASQIKDPPPTKMVRMISANELNTVWSDCMHEQGFDVSITFDGGQAPPIDLPDSQGDAYALANYICYAKYPVDQSTYIFGDEQIRIVYMYYIDRLVPCLEANGYPVDDVPSEATFRATFQSDPWTPYKAVDAAKLSDASWLSLNRSCPQQPSDDILYPSHG